MIMADTFTKEKRSEIMASVRSTNTKPEVVIRRWLHNKGYRFRLHKKDLPGKPDIVLSKYKTVINVNGCFWHRHNGCKYTTTPKTNIEYWQNKFERNVQRDKINRKKLKNNGWKEIVIWECEVYDGSFESKLKFEDKTKLTVTVSESKPL